MYGEDVVVGPDCEGSPALVWAVWGVRPLAFVAFMGSSVWICTPILKDRALDV